MAQWEHIRCGTVHEAGRNPPSHCEFCRNLLIRVGREEGWRIVGRSPFQKQRRKRESGGKAKRGKIADSRRQEIYERDEWRCVKCGSSKRLTLDHKIPLSRGGTNENENLQTMCRNCNFAKGDSLPF